jgi:hypothetical protein
MAICPNAYNLLTQPGVNKQCKQARGSNYIDEQRAERADQYVSLHQPARVVGRT